MPLLYHYPVDDMEYSLVLVHELPSESCDGGTEKMETMILGQIPGEDKPRIDICSKMKQVVVSMEQSLVGSTSTHIVR
jgi:hypothetical protein